MKDGIFEMGKRKEFINFKNTVESLGFIVHEHALFNGDERWKHYNVESPYHRLYFVLKGNPVVLKGNQKLEMSANNCYLIPANSNFSYYTMKPFTKLYFHISVSLFECIDVFDGLSTWLSQSVDACFTEQLLNYMASSKLSDQISAQRMIFEILEQFLLQQNMNLNDVYSKHFQLKEIYEYIHNNRSVQLSESQLNGAFKQSVSSLNKQFKAVHGQTIKQYNDAYCIELAKKQLGLGGLPVKEVAYQLGFKDPYYFSKFFKKYVGISPREYTNQGQIY